MANKIQIKRKSTAGVGSQLAAGELAYTYADKALYIGNATGDGHIRIVKGEGDFDEYLKKSGGTMTGALTLPLAAPTQPDHAANKAYVDNVASGLDVKASVKCVSIGNQPVTMVGGDPNTYVYSNNNPVTIDGYTLRKDDRILLVGQSNQLQNGIFSVKEGGDGILPCVLTRTADATDGTLTGGTFVFVEQGTTYADTGWVCTTDDDPLIIGSTLIEFTQFTGAGSSSFVALSDTPSSYASQGGKSVRVNEAEDGLEFVDSKFLTLADTPNTYSSQGGKLVRVKATEDRLEFVDSTTVGRTKFIELDDTPSAYSNGKIVVSGSAGIQFATNKVFGGLFSDVPSTMGAQNKTLLSNGTSVEFVDFKLTRLSDCPATMGSQYQMLAVGASGKLEFIDVDDSPVNGAKNPITSNWAYDHNAATHTVHGAPAGKNLLHEDSVIDGGTF